MNNNNDDNTQSFVPIVSGTEIAQYKIIEKIGAGGMGEVYLAEDTKLRRKVALKFVSSQLPGDQDAKARFINEARTSAALEHPNICAIHEITEFQGRTFIAMAFIDGQSLKEKIESGPLKLDEALNLGIDIAKGLQEAHEKNIIHRDIKSANVMVSAKGHGKITDFGLAKLVGSSGLTKTGTIMGTASYMSPEQVRGETVDYRADIWSLGVILYEMVTGTLPFKGENEQSVTHQIVHEDLEVITSVRSGIPMVLEQIVNKCMAKDASDRYQHVDDLLVDLRNVGKAPTSQKTKQNKSKHLVPSLLFISAVILLIIFKPFVYSFDKNAFNNPLSNSSFIKLTDIEGSKDVTISPDGKFVAFVSDHEDEFDIWVSQVETGNIYNRTKGQFGDMRRGLQDIGFTANSSEILSFAISNKQSIQSMPLFDGPGRKILRDSVIMANWSPDGNQVVYFTDSPGDPVFVADGDGMNSHVILDSEPGMHQHYQRWSPSGKWIYMTRGRDNNWDTDLWRIKPDGSQLEQLTEDQLDVIHPTPISERVVLYIARDEDGGGPWIWAVDVETKVSQRVSIGLDKYNSLSSSQDGQRIATTVIKPEANMLDIWKVPILDTIATESNVSQYKIPIQKAQAPRFGGDAFYFLSSRGMGDGLWSFSNDQIVEVWSGAKSALFEVPAISPDGNSIAIALKRDGKQYIHLIHSDGSNLRLLSDSVDVRGTGSFSPDGKWIIYGGYDLNGPGLFKISTEDGILYKITDGDALNPIWSPKGDLIVYTAEQVGGFSSLHAIRPDGKKIELPEIKIWVRGERFRFLPDGSGFVYMRGWFSGQDYWLLDITTMKSRRLTNLAKGASSRTFDISPDGKSIVFDRLRVKTEIILIELENNEA